MIIIIFLNLKRSAFDTLDRKQNNVPDNIPKTKSNRLK